MAESSNSKNVIVIDDNESILTLIESTLQELSKIQRIDTALSVPDAQHLLDDRRYDLVMCDWNMPETSGLDLLKNFKSNAATRDIPFVMVTGEVRKEYIMKAIKHGVTDYISKPFHSDFLLKKACQYLKIPCPLK